MFAQRQSRRQSICQWRHAQNNTAARSSIAASGELEGRSKPASIWRSSWLACVSSWLSALVRKMFQVFQGFHRIIQLRVRIEENRLRFEIQCGMDGVEKERLPSGRRATRMGAQSAVHHMCSGILRPGLASLANVLSVPSLPLSLRVYTGWANIQR